TTNPSGLAPAGAGDRHALRRPLGPAAAGGYGHLSGQPNQTGPFPSHPGLQFPNHGAPAAGGRGPGPPGHPNQPGPLPGPPAPTSPSHGTPAAHAPSHDPTSKK